MTRRLMTAVALLVTVLSARGGAHHSFAAEYDINKPITLQRTVTKVDRINPHVYLHLDVKDATSGKVTAWALTTYSPAALPRTGATRADFGPGQPVPVLADHAEDGSHLAFPRRV